jgi:hypothetical protein
MTDFWHFFRSELSKLLSQEDDPAFWQIAIDQIIADTVAVATAHPAKYSIVVEIGRCSHWIQPHWKNRSGMAWPFGYSGTGRSYSSLPEFDWSLQWMRQSETGDWIRILGPAPHRALVHRISLPARTVNHPQGTVHTIWQPGPPEDPKCKLTLVYGFEKSETGWECTAHWEKAHDSARKRPT